MKKFATLSTVAVAVMLGASACSTGGTVTDAPPPATTAAVPAPSAQNGGTVPAPAQSEPKADGIAAFGETFTYDDGIAITVSAPEPGMAGKFAAGAEATGGEVQIFTVTIHNGTGEVLDPAGTYITANHGPDGVSASQVFDTANGLGMTFEGKILPGKKQVGKAAFAIPAVEADVLVSVTPTFAHNSALFQAK